MSKKFENLSSSNRNLSKGLDNLFKPQKLEEQHPLSIEVEKAAPNYIRHTVMFYPEDLEFLKNYVYSEKMSGNINYSQKDALHDAIALLQNAAKNIVERPANVVEYERQRGELISKSKGKG